MNKNLFRKSIAGIVLAGGLLAGTAGIAAAESGTGTAPKPPTEQLCKRAQTTWERLKALDEKLHQHYRKLVELRDKAVAEGRTELADKLTQRLDRVKDRHERIEAKLKEIHDKGVGKCTIPESAAAPLS